MKLKTRGVLYPAHPGRCDEPLCVQIAVRELELGVKVLDADLCKKNSAVVLCYFKFLFAFGISLDIILLDVNDI